MVGLHITSTEPNVGKTVLGLALATLAARGGISVRYSRAAETSSGLILTGLKRPVRLGEWFRFATKKYRLSGVIVRIFRNPIDPQDFPDIARRILNQL